MWWTNRSKLRWWLVACLEVSQQKPSRCLGVHAGRHVGDVAPVALGQARGCRAATRPRDSSTGRAARCGRRGSGACHRAGVDWRSASNGRMLASEGCAPSTSAAARRTNGSASLRWLGGQLGEWLRELGPVDQHFHAVDAQLAVGVGGAGQQRRVVEACRRARGPRGHGLAGAAAFRAS